MVLIVDNLIFFNDFLGWFRINSDGLITVSSTVRVMEVLIRLNPSVTAF